MGSLLSRIRITAVDRVSFKVGAAEIFGLAGESGCGKTTLSRMILGFEEPSSGTIIHKGKDGEPVSGKKVWRTAGVQAVFQNPFETFNPLRQVETAFFEAVENYKLTESKAEALERINSVLETVGMDYKGIASRYPAEFSGGQLQRISIARSLLTEPSLLIADEPVSMVDASIRISIMNLFRELTQKFGVSVIYITHDLATAYYVCDRIGIMFRGNLVTMGSVNDVLLEPKHPYVKLLRASIPGNNPRKRWTTKIKLSDSEHEEYLRTGCKFAGRCPEATERCFRFDPADAMVGEALIRCHKYAESDLVDR
jgi:peptide/nickel transport system ATP-binding protein